MFYNHSFITLTARRGGSEPYVYFTGEDTEAQRGSDLSRVAAGPGNVSQVISPLLVLFPLAAARGAPRWDGPSQEQHVRGVFVHGLIF